MEERWYRADFEADINGEKHYPDSEYFVAKCDAYAIAYAKQIAKEFGFTYLDSGALYRGVTLFAMENGFIDDLWKDSRDWEAFSASLKGYQSHDTFDRLSVYERLVDNLDGFEYSSWVVEQFIRKMETDGWKVKDENLFGDGLDMVGTVVVFVKEA